MDPGAAPERGAGGPCWLVGALPRAWPRLGRLRGLGCRCWRGLACVALMRVASRWVRPGSVMVQQMAAHAEKANPSIIESCSAFYAQHATLVKTLGGAALTIAMAKVAERQHQA